MTSANVAIEIFSDKLIKIFGKYKQFNIAKFIFVVPTTNNGSYPIQFPILDYHNECLVNYRYWIYLVNSCVSRGGLFMFYDEIQSVLFKEKNFDILNDHMKMKDYDIKIWKKEKDYSILIANYLEE